MSNSELILNPDIDIGPATGATVRPYTPMPLKTATSSLQLSSIHYGEQDRSVTPRPFVEMPEPSDPKRDNVVLFIKKILELNKANNLQTALGYVPIVRERLIQLPNVIEMRAKGAFCVGDVHGQIHDLCKVVIEWLKRRADDPDIPFVFLGDAVDRGKHSVECLALIFHLIVNYHNVYFLRGNHEERIINVNMGFAVELINLVSADNVDHIFRDLKISGIVNSTTPHELAKESWVLFNDLFDILPSMIILTTTGDEEYVYALVHGCPPCASKPIDGMDQEFTHYTIPELNQMPKDSKLFLQFRWNDPVKAIRSGISKRLPANTPDPDIFNICTADIESWMEFFNISLIIRGHELPSNGHGAESFIGSDGDPILVTIFTGSNYTTHWNGIPTSGACLIIEESGVTTSIHENDGLGTLVLTSLRELESMGPDLDDGSSEHPNTYTGVYNFDDDTLTPYPVKGGGFPVICPDKD